MKKSAFYLVFTLIALNMIYSVHAANVTSNLSVSNSAPILTDNIPNKSWPSNSNLLNSFNLSSYFTDPNGDSLTFFSSTPPNVTVSIVGGGNVSFYPMANFTGVNNVTFYASDGGFNTSSNLVYLTVGLDSTPPVGSLPSKSKSTVYQNDVLNFSALWTDDFGLDTFNLSINQGSGFVNYTANFSGTQNTSLYTIQISASAGTNVTWFFSANDTSGNVGYTSNNTFTVQSVPAAPSQPAASSSGGSSGGSSYNAYSSSSSKKITNFTVAPEFFKVSLKRGQMETRVLTISNIGNQNMSISLNLRELSDFVVLSESNFNLSPGDSKSITVDFVTQLRSLVGQYFGGINVSSNLYSIDVPIVLDVNDLEVDFEVNVSILNDSNSFNPGDVVSSVVYIRNLRDPIANLTTYVAIKDLYGNIYDSYQEQVSLETSLSLDRKLTLPKEILLGEYIFYARAYTEESTAIDSEIIYVGSEFKLASFIKVSLIPLFAIILVIVILVLFVYYRKERQKERILQLYLLLNELKKHIEDGKTDKAIELYTRIKRTYGEPVSENILKNKDKLKEEIVKLSSKLKGENVNLENKSDSSVNIASKDKNDSPKEGKSDDKK